MKAIELKKAKKPKVWKMLKKTHDEMIKTNKHINDKLNKGNASEVELSKRKLGIEKLEPEYFH